MHETLNARSDLNERAERHERRDLAGNDRSHGMLFDGSVERMLLELLVAKGDLALLSVGLENDEVILLADVKDVLDGLELHPGNVADVHKAIVTVHADECAKLRDALDLAVHDDAGNDVGPEDLFSFLALFLENDFLAGDYTALCVVDLQAGQAQGLAHERFKIVHILLFDLGSGNKNSVRSQFSEQTAFGVALGDQLEHLSVADGIHDLVAFLDLVYLFLGEKIDAVYRLRSEKDRLELGALRVIGGII